AVPSGRLWSLRGLGFTLAVAILALVFNMPLVEPQTAPAATLADTSEGVTVNPGDATLERGSGLIVLANFHRDVPGEATLVIEPKNQPPQRIALVKNLDDPV